jgi:hypothetical protein
MSKVVAWTVGILIGMVLLVALGLVVVKSNDSWGQAQTVSLQKAERVVAGLESGEVTVPISFEGKMVLPPGQIFVSYEHSSFVGHGALLTTRSANTIIIYEYEQDDTWVRKMTIKETASR